MLCSEGCCGKPPVPAPAAPPPCTPPAPTPPAKEGSSILGRGSCSSAGDGCREPGVRLWNERRLFDHYGSFIPWSPRATTVGRARCTLSVNTYLKPLSSSIPFTITTPFVPGTTTSSFFSPFVSNGEFSLSLSSEVYQSEGGNARLIINLAPVSPSHIHTHVRKY